MAEDLTEYLHEQGIRVRYMHSDIDTLERIEIIRDLRLGAFDALVGINLLREGLDIPECALVAILDADKEGFLRSETSLIQTIGRAARNVDGQRHALCRPGHRLDAARHRGDQPAARKAGRVQHRARHHAGEHQALDPRHHGQRLRARPRADFHRRRQRRRIRRRRHHRAQFRGGDRPTWRRACARPPPISTSSRPRACATRSSACAQTELAVVDDPTARNVMVAQDSKLRRAVQKREAASSRQRREARLRSEARTSPASTRWASRSATR